MNIAILSREPENYSTRRLVEVAKLRGHQVDVLDTLRCYMNIASHQPSIHYEGQPLARYDAVIPRIGASITAYGSAVLRQFEMMGTVSLNSALAITRSRDKLRAMQLLSRHGVGLPITGYAHSTRDVPNLISMVGGAPLVVKLLEGTQGIGVVLCETHKAAESVIEAFIQTNNNILVQEYIREANGADIRALVVNGKVVAAMRRQAQAGEFRSNLHRGGEAFAIKLTPEERATALQAAKIMRLDVAGVDILRSVRGPLVLEVNSSPGLQGIEVASSKDVAASMIQFLESKASRKNKPAE